VVSRIARGPQTSCSLYCGVFSMFEHELLGTQILAFKMCDQALYAKSVRLQNNGFEHQKSLICWFSMVQRGK